jgi:uncharacterized protein (DUF2147 family)
MRRLVLILLLSGGLAASHASAAESPLGRWGTIDEKSGKVKSVVEIYDQGGKLFGKIVSLTEPHDKQGKPKICTKCTGGEKDQPIVGLIIIKDLGPGGDRYKGGTILDPEDGKVYRAEIWTEGGKLKVRGYVGLFYRTQTWLRQ